MAENDRDRTIDIILCGFVLGVICVSFFLPNKPSNTLTSPKPIKETRAGSILSSLSS